MKSTIIFKSGPIKVWRLPLSYCVINEYADTAISFNTADDVATYFLMFYPDLYRSFINC